MFHDVLQYKSSKSACLLLYLGSHVCISLGFISCNIHLFMSTFVSRCVCCLYQYPLYTVMVFDNWRNGIPVAFFAISRSREQDLTPVLQALHSRVLKKNATWSPSSIVVDCAQAEINTMRYRQSLCMSFIFIGVALGWESYIRFHVQACLAKCQDIPLSLARPEGLGRKRRQKNYNGGGTCNSPPDDWRCNVRQRLWC